MKKLSGTLLCLSLLLCLLLGCGKDSPTAQETEGGDTVHVAPQDRPPLVRIKGLLYQQSPTQIDRGPRCGTMDGEIKTTVDQSEIPMRDEESNFGTGFGYQAATEGSVDLYINQQFVSFDLVPEEN